MIKTPLPGISGIRFTATPDLFTQRRGEAAERALRLAGKWLKRKDAHEKLAKDISADIQRSIDFLDNAGVWNGDTITFLNPGPLRHGPATRGRGTSLIMETTMSNAGHVYILTNPAMPGLVKVGLTTGPVEDRAKALYSTGVPAPFKVEHSYPTTDTKAAEAQAHAALAEYRVSGRREFFKVSAAKAVAIVGGDTPTTDTTRPTPADLIRDRRIAAERRLHLEDVARAERIAIERARLQEVAIQKMAEENHRLYAAEQAELRREKQAPTLTRDPYQDAFVKKWAAEAEARAAAAEKRKKKAQFSFVCFFVVCQIVALWAIAQ